MTQTPSNKASGSYLINSFAAAAAITTGRTAPNHNKVAAVIGSAQTQKASNG